MPSAILLFIHAAIGWALCGATIGLARRVANLHQALIVHAIAAPLIFVAVSRVYFRWFGTTPPLSTAATFTAVVILLDALVIAPLVERSFAMFRSILGTWLPFALIFLATWATGWFTAHPA
jgi:hypothetical protein